MLTHGLPRHGWFSFSKFVDRRVYAKSLGKQLHCSRKIVSFLKREKCDILILMRSDDRPIGKDSIIRFIVLDTYLVNTMVGVTARLVSVAVKDHDRG